MAFNKDKAASNPYRPGTVEYFKHMGIDANPASVGEQIVRGMGRKADNVMGDVTGANAAKAMEDGFEKGSEEARGDLGAAQEYLGTATGTARGDIQQGTGGALAALRGGYGQARNDIGGTQNRMADLYGGGLGDGFQTDPGYQFRLQQGMDAINAKASAMGGRHGGDTLKALMEHGQNFASNEFNNYAQRQMGLAGAADQGDQWRTGNLAALSQGLGQGQSSLLSGQGSALSQLGMQGAALNTDLQKAIAGTRINPYAGADEKANSDFIGNFFGRVGGTATDKALGKLWE